MIRQLIATKGYGGALGFGPREATCTPVEWTEAAGCTTAEWTEAAGCTEVEWQEAIRLGRVEGFIESMMRERMLPGLPSEVLAMAEAFIESIRREAKEGAQPEVLPLSGAFIESLRAGVPESRAVQLSGTRRGNVGGAALVTLEITLVNASCNDTYMADFASGSNFSNNSTIQLRSASFGGVNRTGLVKFLSHQIPSTATIINAEMTLTTSAEWTSSDQGFDVQRLLRDFSNSQATWDEWESGQAWTVGGAAGLGTDHSDTDEATFTMQTGDPTGTQYVVDVQAIVQAQVAAGEANLNFRIFEQEFGPFASLASTEHATSTWHPKLVITYQTV